MSFLAVIIYLSMVGHIVNSYFYFLHNLCFLEVNNHCFFIACFASVVVVQLLSPVQLFVTPWIAAHQASLSFSISWSLLKLMSIELVMLSNHLILPLRPISSHPLLLLLSIFPGIRVFFFFFFLMNQHFASGGQSIGASSSASAFQWIFRGDFL